MGAMQPQKPPKGTAMALADVIALAIERENKKRRGRVQVTHVLRALEWVRYRVTESTIEALGAPVSE